MLLAPFPEWVSRMVQKTTKLSLLHRCRATKQNHHFKRENQKFKRKPQKLNLHLINST